MKSECTSKNKIYTYSADEKLGEAIEAYAAKTGASKSELSRRAMRKFLNEGGDEAALMLNLVLLTQEFNEMKDDIENERFENIQQLLNNIII